MNRRRFLAGTAATLPLQARAMQRAEQPPAPHYSGKPLKITDVQAWIVNAGRNYVYVKISTDQGIHGWGEAYSAGPDQSTVDTILDFKGWLVGKDPSTAAVSIATRRWVRS